MSEDKSKNVNSGHRQRLKAKYINNGIDIFADHEVLEMLLFYVYPRRDTNKIAHEFINEFGSLSNLFDADVKEIMKRCNTSENVAVLLSLTPALYKKYATSKFDNDFVFDSSKKVGNYAVSLYSDKKYECFYLLCLNGKKGLNHVALISEGTINETSIYVRNIVETALQNNADSVILIHNHPSGSIDPSGSDVESTKLIIDAFKYINIRVLDHIIVANDKYLSFKEANIMKM